MYLLPPAAAAACESWPETGQGNTISSHVRYAKGCTCTSVCVCVCRQQVVFVCFKIFNYFRVSFVVCLFIKSGKSGVEGFAAGLALTQSLIRSLSDLGLAAAGASQDP